MASQIKIWLDKIKTAVYGVEVRDAIHDSIAECYDNVTDAKTLAEDATTGANIAAQNAQAKAALADAAAQNADVKAALAEEKATLADEKATAASAAAESAETAAENANTAKEKAAAAATNAEEKAALSETAAANANAKAALAGEKAELADTAAKNADTKADMADGAAKNADTKAALADSAATNADTASASAETAAANAEAAAAKANTAADNADTKASLAATAAGNANIAITAANDAAANANAAKSACEKATTNVQTAITNANDKAALAESAAQNADDKAALANGAAANAEEKAALANTKASLADERIAVINSKIESADAAVAKAEKAAADANQAADNASKGIIGQASSNALGGVKADTKTENDTQAVRIDTESGKLYTAGLPTASSDVLGGVKVGENLLVDTNGVMKVDTTDEVAETEKPIAANAVYAVMQNTQQKIVASGLLKGDGAGGVNTAVAGEDYVAPQEGKNLSTNDYTNEEKQKLSGIETGANAYNHPTHSPYESGFYKMTVDEKGHVTAAVGVEKADITALGIPAQDTTYQLASADEAGLLSAADKTKLDSVESGAEKNIPPTWTALEGKPEAFTPVSHEHAIGNISGLEEALAGKVDIEAGKALSTNDYTTVEKNKLAGLSAPVAVTVTLAAASWTEGTDSATQTVNVTGVTATNSVIVQAAPASREAWLEADVYCSAQGAGTLTFTCEAAPESALTANVLILEVSG